MCRHARRHGTALGAWCVRHPDHLALRRRQAFTCLNVPFGSDAQCAELIIEHLTGAAESAPVDAPAVAALVAAGPAVDRATLESVFDGEALDVDAALAAARSFAPGLDGSHPA
jgi:hypothetical protein